MLHSSRNCVKRLLSIQVYIRNQHALADINPSFKYLNKQVGEMVFKEKAATCLLNKFNLYQNYQLRCVTTKQHESLIDLGDVFDSNLGKLMNMLRIGKTVLVDIFIIKWNTINDIEWRKKICKELLEERWCELYYKSDPANATDLIHDCVKYWSIAELCETLKCLNVDFPYHIFEKFGPINDKIEALYFAELHSTHNMGLTVLTDEEFADFFKRISTLLLELDVHLEKIDRHKLLFQKPLKLSSQMQKYDVNVQEIMDQGNTSLEEGRFEEAIKLYTEAICTSAGLDSAGAPNLILGQLYSNRSTAHRKVNNISSSEKDAERANYFIELMFKECKTKKDLHVSDY